MPSTLLSIVSRSAKASFGLTLTKEQKAALSKVPLTPLQRKRIAAHTADTIGTGFGKKPKRKRRKTKKKKKTKKRRKKKSGFGANTRGAGFQSPLTQSFRGYGYVPYYGTEQPLLTAPRWWYPRTGGNIQVENRYQGNYTRLGRNAAGTVTSGVSGFMGDGRFARTGVPGKY